MSQDLFSYSGQQIQKRNAPLADRLRPKTLDDFLGQKAILAEGRLLRRAIAADRVGNLILHGPPGVGKTTLARIIAANTRSNFTILNAVLAGIKQLREEVEAAIKRLERHGLRTILFVDEVHRFNTAQQDALLPWVENGTVILIGATTENPYFEVNKALVSRSRLFRLQPLEPDALHQLVKRALQDVENGFGKKQVEITNDAVVHLVKTANGDARSLLNALELAVESTPTNSDGLIKIDLHIAEESIQEKAVLYDKQGDMHFDTISAFIKSLRGSDQDAALFWLARMLEAGENPRFIFRRMLIAAGEDVGLADPHAIVVVEACAAAFERIGLPEGIYALAQAALYLASTDKSNSLIGFFQARKIVQQSQSDEVPSHLRDSHRDKDAFGDGLGYRYPHAFQEHWIAQQYLPNSLQGEVFWHPTNQGWEGKRRSIILERRAAQMAATFEFAQDIKPSITSGPEFSQLERWIQRQSDLHGQRLEQLAEKLWLGISLQPNDRVLVIGGSLLWALQPLKEVPEGGVSLLGVNANDLSRLSAELEILDPIHRPLLMVNGLQSLIQLSSDLQFEWVGGRISKHQLISEDILKYWEAITRKCAPNSGLSLLLSFPTLGPIESILPIISERDSLNFDNDFIDRIISLEQKYLNSSNTERALLSQLSELGWAYKVEEWYEVIPIHVNEELVRCWLSENQPFLNFLKSNFSNSEIERIRVLMEKCRGELITQKVTHKKIIGELYMPKD